jgi:hypothetical protein
MIHQSLYAGLQLVVMPKFDLEDFCRFIQEHKITFAYVVPPVVLLLGKHPVVEKYDLSTIRMMNSGAAPLTRELVDAVNKRLGIPIKQGYGLSETSPTTHTQPWEDWNKTIGPVGTLLPDQTAMYLSPEEKELPTGEVGELWIKGPNVFKGYLNNPEGTANALTADGFFKTGDVGYQDKDGNFFITDRIKEVITSSPLNKQQARILTRPTSSSNTKASRCPPPSSRVSLSPTRTSKTAPSSACTTRSRPRSCPAPTSCPEAGWGEQTSMAPRISPPGWTPRWRTTSGCAAACASWMRSPSPSPGRY